MMGHYRTAEQAGELMTVRRDRPWFIAGARCLSSRLKYSRRRHKSYSSPG